MSRFLRSPFPVVAGVVLGGCASLAPSEAVLPAGAVRMSAPAIYAEWYWRTEACSGTAGAFSTVEWYVVPGVATFSTPHGEQVGMWQVTGGKNRVVIAGDYTGHEMVVRHEMLHQLLGREGHPPEFFAERCRLTWDSWPGGAAGPAMID